MVINGTWSSPEVVIYRGGNATVVVNGTAYVGGVAVIEVEESGKVSEDTVRRILISASGGVSGAFVRVELKGQQRDARTGRCYSYFAASQEQQDGQLSVLLVPREEKCKSKPSTRWIVAGVVFGDEEVWLVT